MAESMKPRFAVDLDEIERQLAYAQSTPAPGQNPARHDPLAELARIVGQDDPFQSILAADRPAHAVRRDPGAFDDLFVAREPSQPPREDVDRPFEPEVPTDLDAAYGEPGRAFEAYEDQVPAQVFGHRHSAQDEYADPAEDDDTMPVRRYPARNSRKGMVAVAAVLGAAVLGVGGALMVGGSPTGFSVGEPPLVKATNEPTKVPPQTPGGVEFPNQNKQIYERAAQDAPTQVVNREEQPVDVKQAVRTASADPGAAKVAPQAPAGGLSLGEPRKVRTISIRPDGTVILPDSKPAAAPPQVAAPVVTPPAIPIRPAAPPAAAPIPSETPHSAAPSATPAAASSRVAASTPATSGGSSPQAAPPQAQPAPQRVASAQPTALAVTPAPEEAAPVGGFAVQLGVSGSEGEAKSALQRFQQKFAALDGKPPLIRKAEVNGNSLYRIRVGPMSREEASSLCSKIQGQGGQCFVAKN